MSKRSNAYQPAVNSFEAKREVAQERLDAKEDRARSSK